MVHCTLWAFDKKKNSTKQPTSGGTAYTGEIKEGFSVSELAICFNFGTTVYAPVYNYLHIDELRRYYFIMDWNFAGGLWWATCAVDVLATFKTEIGNSLQYVSRAYSDYDPNLIDTTYLTTPANITRLHSSVSPSDFYGGNIDAANGTIVMGVVGSNTGAVGAVTYYAMSFAVFASFMHEMLSNVTWANISATEISQELQKALINPTQYIVSCTWFPILYSSLNVGTSTATLNLGWWNFTLSANAKLISNISQAYISRQTELTIPKHPQSVSPRLGYLQCAPYSSYMLKFLPFGVFEIDSTELYDKTYLGVLVDFNLITGDAVLHVTSKGATGTYDFENSFLVSESNVGVTIPMGQVSANMGNYKQALGLGLATGVAGLIANSTGTADSTSHHSGKF